MLTVPETISESEADVLGMPVAFYERAVRFGASRATTNPVYMAPILGDPRDACTERGIERASSALAPAGLPGEPARYAFVGDDPRGAYMKYSDPLSGDGYTGDYVLFTEHEALRALFAAQQRDGERYRWLRNRISGREYRALGLNYGEISDVDSLIDAALAGEERK